MSNKSMKLSLPKKFAGIVRLDTLGTNIGDAPLPSLHSTEKDFLDYFAHFNEADWWNSKSSNKASI